MRPHKYKNPLYRKGSNQLNKEKAHRVGDLCQLYILGLILRTHKDSKTKNQ